MLFAWDDRLALNVALIDEEHRSLFALAQRLYEAMAAGQARERLGDILFELLRYTRVHFAHEEHLMERHAYPRLSGHRRQHHDLTDRVQDFHARFVSGETGLGLDLLQFLRTWLDEHIATSDAHLAAWLWSRGITRPPSDADAAPSRGRAG
jgi:hemerythrin